MRAAILMACLVISLGACRASEPAGETNASPTANIDQPERPAQGAVAGWHLQSSGEGVALALLGSGGGTAVRLFCPAVADRLLVNVPAFRPVGSEERMSFGSGGNAVALVADSRGDAQQGVGGTGPVPDDLPALIGGPVAVNYGSQNSGPHPAPPPADAVRAFASACSEAPRLTLRR